MRFHSFTQQTVTKALPSSFGYTKLTVLVMILGCKQQKPTLHTQKEYLEEIDGREENWVWEMDRK